MNEKQIEKIAVEIQSEWEMSGLFAGIYKDFFLELLKRLNSLISEDESGGVKKVWIAQHHYDAFQNYLNSLVGEDEWISVEDELPDDGKFVLAWTSDILYRVMFQVNGDWKRQDGTSYLLPVTHWQPLPAAPKETEWKASQEAEVYDNDGNLVGACRQEQE